MKRVEFKRCVMAWYVLIHGVRVRGFFLDERFGNFHTPQLYPSTMNQANDDVSIHFARKMATIFDCPVDSPPPVALRNSGLNQVRLSVSTVPSSINTMVQVVVVVLDLRLVVALPLFLVLATQEVV